MPRLSATTNKQLAERPAATNGSIGQAFAILRHLSDAPHRPGVTLIATQLGISPSSCFNVLKKLVAEGVVDFDSRSKTYSLGWGLLGIVGQALGRTTILSVLGPTMEVLAERFSSAVGVWHLGRDRRPTLIWLAEDGATTRIHLTIGQRLPPFAGAVGRCAAAHECSLSDETISLFNKLRLAKPVSIDQFRGDLKEVRRRGYAIDGDVYMQGVTSIAAGVTDGNGDLVYCLSASMFSGRYGPKELRIVGRELGELALRAHSVIAGGTVP